MATVFTKILNGEIPGHVLAQDKAFFAILDIHPIAPGHTLVIPKQEVENVFNMDEGAYSRLFLFAKRLAPAIQQASGAARVGIAVEGFGVPHVHVHLVPINALHDLKKSGYDARPEELKKMQEKITLALSRAKA
jgi:histidine triad (HIT) family protein